MRSSSTVQHNPVRYQEVQQFKAPWIWIIVGLVAALQWWGFIQQIVLGKPWGNQPAPDWMMLIFWLIFGIGLPVFFLYTRLRVTVTDDTLTVNFRPLVKRRIPLADIAIAETRTYSPLREYGGWGIRRTFDGKRAYNVSGDRGVELTLLDGRHILIGSRNPDELASAIAGAQSALGR